MDVVYVCRSGENPELRYSLRSLTNVPHDRVWILGGWPAWVGNVEAIERPTLATKYLTTTAHLRAACENEAISDPFILFNDDFYVTCPFPAIPSLHRGRLVSVINQYRIKSAGQYVQGMVATRKLLLELGHREPLSYELHVPLVIHKAAMLKAIEIGEHLPVLHKRTLYGNLAALGGDEIADVKVWNEDQPIPRGPWLSSSDASLAYLEPHLSALFPTPSPYES